MSLGLRAQTYRPICTAEMLDVRVYLPPEALAGSVSAHLLVLDVRNRAKEACNLGDFVVHLPTEDGYGYRFGGGPDRSTAAKTFAGMQSRISPGDEVHRVIAWSSVPQTQEQYDGCFISDGLTALNDNKVVLDVRHLWLEQCGEAWLSSMRAGAFVPGEELSPEWMARYDLNRNDVSEPLPPSTESVRLRSSVSVSYLMSSFESGYSGWFTLWLERPTGVGGRCAFRTLRRREYDGRTIVVVNHCPPAKENSPEASKRFFEILPRDYKMLPEHVGQVDYESTSEIVHEGRTVAASGIISVEVRDPTDPMLPAIETTFKPCRADQLVLQTVLKLGNQVDIRNLAPMADVPRARRAYTFTNVSQETCLVGGTPDLQFREEPDTHVRTGFGACRDCSDALFTARGQHWITLEPAKSAHFIITGKPLYGIFHNPCAFFPKLVLVFADGGIQLDYGLASCGQVDVSAWRDGAYDDDPLNLHYSRAKKSVSGIGKPPALPQACAKVVTPQTSVPFMFPSRGPVQFGLSSRPSTFRDNAPLAIWVSNPTDKEVGVMTCADLDGFFIGGFDVLDQSGNRVLAKEEVKAKDQPGRRGYARELMACTRNFAIPIPPHSCVHGDLDKPGYDFVKNLGSMYTLPVGRYQIVPRIKEGVERLQTTGLPVEVTP